MRSALAHPGMSGLVRTQSTRSTHTAQLPDIFQQSLPAKGAVVVHTDSSTSSWSRRGRVLWAAPRSPKAPLPGLAFCTEGGGQVAASLGQIEEGRVTF